MKKAITFFPLMLAGIGIILIMLSCSRSPRIYGRNASELDSFDISLSSGLSPDLQQYLRAHSFALDAMQNGKRFSLHWANNHLRALYVNGERIADSQYPLFLSALKSLVKQLGENTISSSERPRILNHIAGGYAIRSNPNQLLQPRRPMPPILVQPSDTCTSCIRRSGIF
jgi:hypothetical protein